MGSRLRSLGRGAPAPRLPLLRPLLRLRGRRSLRKLLRVWPLLRRTAPRPARNRSRIGATCAAGGRQGLQEAASGRDARAAPRPASARVGTARGQLPLLLWGAGSSHASLPHPQIEIMPPDPGR